MLDGVIVGLILAAQGSHGVFGSITFFSLMGHIFVLFKLLNLQIFPNTDLLEGFLDDLARSVTFIWTMSQELYRCFGVFRYILLLLAQVTGVIEIGAIK